MNFLIDDMNIPLMQKRSDKHLNNLKNFFLKSMEGINPSAEYSLDNKIYVNPNYSKIIDINMSNRHLIEFKSISSSFGKNTNNRIEEMVGQCQLLSDIGKVSYVFVYHDTASQFKYYDKIKGVMQYLLDLGLLHSAVLYKVTSAKVVEDADFNIETFLGSIERNEKKSINSRWFERILQGIHLRSKRLFSRATNRWHKGIY
tara:strand:+ start:581 stop:1183 length:603 start_codon:yes stop_codon:yes gene_type:complete